MQFRQIVTESEINDLDVNDFLGLLIKHNLAEIMITMMF